MTTPVTADAIAQIRDLTEKASAKFSFASMPASMFGQPTLSDAPMIGLHERGGAVQTVDLRRLIAPWLSRPLQRKGTAHAYTLASFVDLVKRHANPHSTCIFVDPSWREPSITAVIDYHEAGAAYDGADPGAAFCQHRIVYAYPLADAWTAWLCRNGAEMSQAKFAAHLEDHIIEVVSPAIPEAAEWETRLRTKFATPNELLDLAEGLDINIGGRMKQRQRLQSGETEIVFEVEHKDHQGKKLVVPGLFMISVAPFVGGEVIRVPVRLRYRAKDGELAWSYEMIRPELFIEQRIVDDMSELASACGCPVYAAQPETISDRSDPL